MQEMLWHCVGSPSAEELEETSDYPGIIAADSPHPPSTSSTFKQCAMTVCTLISRAANSSKATVKSTQPGETKLACFRFFLVLFLCRTVKGTAVEGEKKVGRVAGGGKKSQCDHSLAASD